MGWFSLTGLLSIVFLGYIGNSIYHFYNMFTPVLCQEGSGNCLLPRYEATSEGRFELLQLRVYTTVNRRQLGQLLTSMKTLQVADPSSHKKMWYALLLVCPWYALVYVLVTSVSEFLDDFEGTGDENQMHEKMQKSYMVNLTLPASVRKNGTLFVNCFLLPSDFSEENPFSAPWYVQDSSSLSVYTVPAAETFRLIAEKEESNEVAEKKSDSETEKKAKIARKLRESNTPVTHVRRVIPIASLNEAPHFARNEIASELRQVLNAKNNKYLPVLYIDQLSFRKKDLEQITTETETVEIDIDYRPVSIGKLRLLITTMMSMNQLRGMGFGDKEIDEVKAIFVETNLYLLLVTMVVSALHMLFDVLSFKNDISFWRNRKTMVGLSSKGLLWRCFSYTVIFFYLLDQDTSLLVLVPSGISTLIEFWKITKAFKISFSFTSGLKFGAHTKEEEETEAFDTQAMKWLAWLMLPLCVGGAVYSLAYVPHKSWRSWVLESAANGVYAFGFLFMLPQLFVNYKLKSVAHLPWRAFMYKAFNTFIDDLFAFIITMPVAHRVACFRDDIVFVVYLYQRYLYPVDHTRVNEYGETGDDQPSEKNTIVVSEEEKKNQ